MTAILTLLNAARAQAIKSGLPTRRKDKALYSLLSGCLFICEKVQREGLEQDLRDALKVSIDERNPDVWGQGRKAGNNGKGRRYAENGSDAYVLVVRYVMEGSENYATRSRYAIALREAGKRQIRSENLVEWLIKNGGVRELFIRKDSGKDILSRRTLELNQPVSFHRGEVFMLRLRYDGKGCFDVLD